MADADSATNAGAVQNTPPDETHLKKVNEEIYKRNLELAVVNKTLSLLGKLYQISLQNLEPAAISEKISEIVRADLNMETVGVFLFHEQSDSLTAFTFSTSKRLSDTLNGLGVEFRNHKIEKVSQTPEYKELVYGKKPSLMQTLQSVWGSVFSPDQLKALNDASHIQAILAHPLIASDKTIGILFFGLNRAYEDLSSFEKESIHDLVNVAAVALDKALVYEQLKAANQSLKALDQARADFITLTSHQLRTPPATIKWYLAAIKDGDYGKLLPETLEAIAKTEVTNNAQISLIDDLLNASRIERGKMEFLFEPVHLDELTKFTVEQLQPQASIKGLVLTYTPPTTPTPEVLADKEKIRQVINNFIDNAIKYSPKGSIIARMKVDSKFVSVEVQDSGKGIDKDVIASLFHKYSRGKDSVTHATGIGIGLYVAKIVVENHRGEIGALSDGVGKGSIFYFRIPIKNDLPHIKMMDLVDQQKNEA